MLRNGDVLPPKGEGELLVDLGCGCGLDLLLLLANSYPDARCVVRVFTFMI